MRTAPSSTHRLALASHVRACAIEDQVILLDLSANRYLGIGGPALAALEAAVDDWPPIGMRLPSMSSKHTSASIAAPLIARGWVTEASQRETRNAPPAPKLPEATRTLSSSSWSARPTRKRTLRCLQGALSASWSLSFHSLLEIGNDIADRRERLRHDAVDTMEPLVEATGTYLRARPFFFSARDRCLRDSLALVNFLAYQSLSAHWVIGVRVRPFAAHAWVQHEKTVLNDQHERIRRFRPIFVA